MPYRHKNVGLFALVDEDWFNFAFDEDSAIVAILDKERLLQLNFIYIELYSLSSVVFLFDCM